MNSKKKKEFEDLLELARVKDDFEEEEIKKRKSLKAWGEVSANFEKADSQHCANLDKL